MSIGLPDSSVRGFLMARAGVAGGGVADEIVRRWENGMDSLERENWKCLVVLLEGARKSK